MKTLDKKDLAVTVYKDKLMAAINECMKGGFGHEESKKILYTADCIHLAWYGRSITGHLWENRYDFRNLDITIHALMKNIPESGLLSQSDLMVIQKVKDENLRYPWHSNQKDMAELGCSREGIDWSLSEAYINEQLEILKTLDKKPVL